MGATPSKTTDSKTPIIEYALKVHDHNALYQPKGDYALKTEVYAKPMVDEKYATFQPKGDYALKSDLLNLKGPKGDAGQNGSNGIDGKNGAQGPPGEVTRQFLKENSLWCADGDICSAPKDIALPSGKAITFRDKNHGIVYDTGVDGPNIYGYGGGKLSSAGGKEALRWDTFGNTTFGGGAIFGAGATFNAFTNLNGTSTHGGLATFNGDTRFNKNISVHPDNTFSIDEPNIPGGRVMIDKTSARFGGNLSVANQLTAKRITIGAWTIEETPKGLNFNKAGTGSYVIKPMDGDRWVNWSTNGI